MNIYLNEKCKDAMTLSDFIDNLQISDEDFETTRTEGIVSGLTDIFTKELRNLDVRKLPIHCSDIKRETFYIKEENEWVKDDGKKSILSRAIDKAKGMANKFLPVWIDDHQNCWKSESPYHTEWMNVITMRFGDGDPRFNEKNTKKIIKKPKITIQPGPVVGVPAAAQEEEVVAVLLWNLPKRSRISRRK